MLIVQKNKNEYMWNLKFYTMINLIKKLILWINKYPFYLIVTLLTACIPLAFLAFKNEWSLLGLIFGILGGLSIILWGAIIWTLICCFFSALWEQIVEWAEK